MRADAFHVNILPVAGGCDKESDVDRSCPGVTHRLLRDLNNDSGLRRTTRYIAHLHLTLGSPDLIGDTALGRVSLIGNSFFANNLFRIIVNPNRIRGICTRLHQRANLTTSAVTSIGRGDTSGVGTVRQLIQIFSSIFVPVLPTLVITNLLVKFGGLVNTGNVFVRNRALLRTCPDLSKL